ncbi:hypothetical protein BDV96DRAFT_663981 [Lophiotrema nucula]|uniref:Uncharacterized protein n=1 Tax=Lophiotrema nucula TaxID=690887 RepID=A0A6A5Z0Z1_9PLEO|nr:hypothetical protein BDV96DRAFT_663981 [Lophiotrema nucula]
MLNNRSRSRPTDIIITPATIDATAWRAPRPATPAVPNFSKKTIKHRTVKSSTIPENDEDRSSTIASPAAPRLPPVSYWSPDTISPFSPLPSAFLKSSRTFSPVSPMMVDKPLRSSSTIFSPTFMNPRTPPMPPSLLLSLCPPSPYYAAYMSQVGHVNMGRRHSIASVKYNTGQDDVTSQVRRFSLAAARAIEKVDRQGPASGTWSVVESLSSKQLREKPGKEQLRKAGRRRWTKYIGLKDSKDGSPLGA